MNAYKKSKLYKQLKTNSKDEIPSVSLTNEKQPGQLSITEFRQFAFTDAQRNKPDYESPFSNEPKKSNIRYEYMEKTLLYGYLMVKI
jgi:hypothetical protein